MASMLYWRSLYMFHRYTDGIHLKFVRGRKKQSSGGGAGRWVVVDTGDADGPIPGGLLMYRSDKDGDYHGEFCGDT